MKVIVVGCGKIGYAIIRSLAKEGHEVVVIDQNPARLEAISSALDVMGVPGNGASHAVQMEADIMHADLFIALTNNDELNMLCAMIAHKTSNVRTIARVSDSIYVDEIGYISKELGLALAINPEQLAAKNIVRLLKTRNAIDMETFQNGRVELVKVKITEGSKSIGMSVSDIIIKSKARVLICGVDRDGEVVIPGGDFVVQNGDRLAIVGEMKSVNSFIKWLGISDLGRVRQVVVLGINNLSEYVIKGLVASGMRVKVFDGDYDKCSRLSGQIPEITVIQSDPSQLASLIDEGFDEADACVAVTKEDELNVLVSIYASQNSNEKVITLLNHDNYKEIVSKLEIGSVLSLQQVSANTIVRYVRAVNRSKGSNMLSFTKIMDDKLCALEFRVSEDSAISDVPLKELRLESGSLIGTIMRDNKIIIPYGETVIKRGDKVVLITTDENITDIEQVVRVR